MAVALASFALLLVAAPSATDLRPERLLLDDARLAATGDSDAEDSDAEDSDAEDSDAEDSDAEDSDAEDSDAEDSDAEDSDAEDSDAEDSDAEDSDAEDSDAEDSDAEDSDAEDSDAENSDAEDSNAEEHAGPPDPDDLADEGAGEPENEPLKPDDSGAVAPPGEVERLPSGELHTPPEARPDGASAAPNQEASDGEDRGLMTALVTGATGAGVFLLMIGLLAPTIGGVAAVLVAATGQTYAVASTAIGFTLLAVPLVAPAASVGVVVGAAIGAGLRTNTRNAIQVAVAVGLVLFASVAVGGAFGGLFGAGSAAIYLSAVAPNTPSAAAWSGVAAAAAGGAFVMSMLAIPASIGAAGISGYAAESPDAIMLTDDDEGGAGE